MVLPIPTPLNAADHAWASLLEAINSDRFGDSVQAAQELYELAAQGVYPRIRFLGHHTKQLPEVQVTLSDDGKQALLRTPPKRLILAPKRIIDLDADESGYAQIDGRSYLVTGHGPRTRSATGSEEEVKRRLQLPESAYSIPWLRDWMADAHEGYLWSISAAPPGLHLEELNELVIGSFIIQRQETSEGVSFIMGIDAGDSLRDVVTLCPAGPVYPEKARPSTDDDTDRIAVQRILKDVVPAMRQAGAFPVGEGEEANAMRMVRLIGPSLVGALRSGSADDPVQSLLALVRNVGQAAMRGVADRVTKLAARLDRSLTHEEADALRQELLAAVQPDAPADLGTRDGYFDGFDPLEMDDDLTLGSRKYIDLDPAHQRIVNELITILTPAVEAHLLDPRFAKLLTEPTRGVADATAFMVEKVVADLRRKEVGEKESPLDHVRKLINQAWEDRKYAHIRDASVGQMFQRLGVGRDALRAKGTNALRVLGKVFQKLADTIRASIEGAEGVPTAEQPEWWPQTAEWPQRTAAGPDSDIRF